MYTKDTIVSTITPVSGGSITVLRISGENAISITNKFFKSHDLIKSEGNRFYFGSLLDAVERVIDEVVICVFKKPKSYTGEDVIEISCHSNVFIIEDIISLFLENGCRVAEPGEFSKRSFLNGKMDLIQAEAVADLISSKSRASVKNAINLLDGHLSKKIVQLKNNLVDIGSLLELELDFSEEDLEIISKEKYISTIDQTISIVEKLLSSYDHGREFQKGIEVLIAGKPNVGKSSLMNALLERDRVIVSHVPGTTRDLIHEDIILGDVLIRLIDTAGIRFTLDRIEAEGVTRARKLLQTANIILILIDLSQPIDNDDIEIIQSLLEMKQEKIIIIGNKIDKELNNDTCSYLNKLDLEMIQISAKEEKNINQLKQTLLERIKSAEKLFSEDIVLSNKRQYKILSRVKDILEENRISFQNNDGFEFIAVDLRLAIDTLSEITGEISTDDILNNIFSNFCIGK